MASSAFGLSVVFALSAAFSVLARDLQCPAEARVCCPDGPTHGKLLTTATFELPWAENLVRSRETSIGNLISFSQHEFLIARFPIPPMLPLLQGSLGGGRCGSVLIVWIALACDADTITRPASMLRQQMAVEYALVSKLVQSGSKSWTRLCRLATKYDLVS